MTKKTLWIVAVSLFSLGFSQPSAHAGSYSYTVPVAPANTNPYVNPYANPYVNPYANPYVNPYANPYVNPYNPYAYNNTLRYNSLNYGIPQSLPNGYFGFNGIGVNFWRAPSGYYYPWCGGGFAPSTTILYVPTSGGQATQAQPPISTIVGDLVSFLDDSKTKGRMSEADYTHLRQRALDLQSKQRNLVVQGGGALDPQDEQIIRRDLDQVQQEALERLRKVQ